MRRELVQMRTREIFIHRTEAAEVAQKNAGGDCGAAEFYRRSNGGNVPIAVGIPQSWDACASEMVLLMSAVNFASRAFLQHSMMLRVQKFQG